jgi:hypothetical protein
MELWKLSNLISPPEEQGTGYRGQVTGYRLQRAEYRLQGTGYRVRNSVQRTAFRTVLGAGVSAVALRSRME